MDLGHAGELGWVEGGENVFWMYYMNEQLIFNEKIKQKEKLEFIWNVVLEHTALHIKTQLYSPLKSG